MNPHKTNLILFDDVISDALEDRRIGDLFTKGCHHRNLSLILISQNLFQKDKEAHTISLNTHYMILFNNPRDVTQMQTLARKTHLFIKKYNDIVSKIYASLFIDLKTTTPDSERLSDTEKLFAEIADMCDTEDVPKKSNNDENGEKPIQAVFNLNTKEETNEDITNDGLFTCELCGYLCISQFDLERQENEFCPHHMS